MSGDGPPKPRMSLYANLLDPKNSSDAPGTISSAPVVYKQPEGSSNGGASERSEDIIAAAKQKLNAAALRFQPTKRPTIGSQKTKTAAPRPVNISSTQSAQAVPKGSSPAAVTPGGGSGIDSTTGINRASTKTTIEDWKADSEDDDYYLEQKRQQQKGARKKRKKNKEKEPLPVNWDDIYDPSRPNNYEEYQHSDEHIREIREWKDRLYAHRISSRRDSDTDSDDDRVQVRNQFAPPGMSFAPPSNIDEDQASPPPPPPPPPMGVPDDATGEDAYARRVRMSQLQAQPAAPPTPSPPPPPPTSATAEPLQATTGRPAPDISRAPVRYNLPPPPPDIPQTEAELEDALQREEDAYEDEEGDGSEQPDDEDAPRSLRPGQKGFAERLMNKYGWTKGSGLGRQGTGITSALRVQVEKRKKRPDAEGGGFVGPGGRGKIIGGQRKDTDGQSSGGEQNGKFGAMSEVIVLLGMLDGMDLQRELADGNLVQEIGEECGEKYGRVERVFVDQSAQEPVPVFVKFTSQLSGLRAVNALEGRAFGGNTIAARFFDKDKFDRGDYTV